MLVQRGTFEILHREVGDIGIFAGIVNRDDIRVVQATCRFRFTPELILGRVEIGIAEFFGQRDRLDRYLAVDVRIEAQVHGGHRAAAQRL